jgi:uncharacterized protein YjbJ (UPF0337 family)
MKYTGEIKGKAKQVKGTAEETLGKSIGNREMESKGERERFEGKVQERMSKARRAVGEAVEDLGEEIAG